VLDDLNTDQTLDATKYLNEYISNDENISQFFQTKISSSYVDINTLLKTFTKTTEPLLLSINIQSLNSKFESLKAMVRTLQNSEIPVDLIILQETWELKFPEKLILPGFQRIVSRTRQVGRGGGVGIYVRNGLNFKERQDLENNKVNTFENVVLEIQYPKKSIIVSNVYIGPHPRPLRLRCPSIWIAFWKRWTRILVNYLIIMLTSSLTLISTYYSLRRIQYALTTLIR
jgi:hypothetical protein